ncbi:MAG: DUF255 domain-containing protein [Phycisphaerales bacterium]|jgi:hypothetical protein|nr:DUF255 domain-containing protein [Phycisphaerales bacterium]
MPTQESVSRAAATVLAALCVAVPAADASEVPVAHSDHPANRLAHETSPYLLQHAHNPVHWYPWGEDAFAAARAEDKPIFLSIGYSTCYWCHVMERQCFESPAVAEVLNAYFIPVKVDREERPDVDEVYMTAVQIMTRHGGWPLSVWLDPDTLMPFFGGTYFPPEDQGSRPGFVTLLHAIHQAWLDKNPEMRAQADRVGAAVVNRLASIPEQMPLEPGLAQAAVAQLMASYDPQHAGYGQAPKFPMPVHLNLLLEAAWDREDVRNSLRHTLDRMAMGGMYDQVGGGFHRYSTDARWLVPHFEKMLYDNGMLASVYAEAAARTGDSFYAAIAAETLDYVLREMVDPTGAFWSAQDAESNAREGASYLWTPTEVREAVAEGSLPEAWADFALTLYGLDRGTNFRDPHHPNEPASNVLYLPDHPKALAEASGLSIPEFHERVVAINEALLDRRDTRDQPITDDKILAGWNGLMIGGMADGGRLLGDPRYVAAARRAADWIKDAMWTQDGGLKRTARSGQVSEIPGFLEDYAFLVRGLLKLHEASGEQRDLEWAVLLMKQAHDRFFDGSAGWFDAEDGDEALFVRGRSLHDGAVPSGTSVMLDNQRRLHQLTGDEAWLDAAAATVRPVALPLNQSPRAAAQAVAALHHLEQLAPDRFGGAPHAREAVVSIRLEPAAVSIDASGGASSAVVFDIASPWHVALHGGDGAVLPARVESATAGVLVTASWPEGTLFKGPVGAARVMEGTVSVPIVLKVEGDVPEAAQIAVTWQACDDRICLKPETRIHSIELQAAPGS